MTKPDDISTVIGLFRVSTEAQEREGYSLQAQERAYERDCRTFGWRSLQVFQGQETGSALDQRQIIHELIAFVRENRPDAVWIIEQSRLTRGDDLDVALQLRELRETGTKVVTERGHVVDPTDIEGDFAFRMKALIDRREWQIIAARSRRAKDEKARRGLLVNARPAYGYQTSGEGRDKGQRIIVPEEAAVVRQIFEWTAAGITGRGIIQRLYDQGVPAPCQAGRSSGAKPKRFKHGLQLWGRSTVRRFLGNPIYLGVSYRHCWLKKGSSFVFEPENPDAIWVENAHEPTITQELWDAAHRQIKLLTNAKHTEIHMLTGILKCAVCGNTYNVTTSKDRRGNANTYYFCKSKRQVKDEYGNFQRTANACRSKWLPLGKTDKLVWDAFVRLICSPDIVEQFLASASAEKKRSRLRSEIEDLERSAVKIEDMMARAREKLLTEILTDGEYLRERERLATQIKGITTRLVTKRSEWTSSSKDAAMQVIQNLAILKLGEKKMSRDQRSRLFHALVKRVVPKDNDFKRVEIELYVRPATDDRRPPDFTVAGREFEPTTVSMRLPTEAIC